MRRRGCGCRCFRPPACAEEQAAVQIGDGTEQVIRLWAALALRFGEAFKEERVQEFAVIAVGAAGFAFLQLVIEVAAVPLDEAALLQEVDEHQAVKQHRGIPSPIIIVWDAFDQVDEFNPQVPKSLVKSLGDPLDIEGGGQAAGHRADGHAAVFTQLVHLDDHAIDLAHEQIARLPLEIVMAPGTPFAILALDPVHHALGAVGVVIQEDDDILMRQFGDLGVDPVAGAFVGQRPVRRAREDFEHSHAGHLGDEAAL